MFTETVQHFIEDCGLCEDVRERQRGSLCKRQVSMSFQQGYSLKSKTLTINMAIDNNKGNAGY